LNIRLYNARIYDPCKKEQIMMGEVRIQDDKIFSVIREGDEPDEGFVPDREIDCAGNLLMRGFNDAHTHSAMTFLRSLADDKPTPAWLREDVFPVEARLTDDDIAAFQKIAIMEYVSGGICSVMDMYLRPDVTAEVFSSAGMRAVIVSGLNDFTSSTSQMEDEYKRLNFYHPLISYKMGIHAEYTCSEGLLREVSGLVKQYGASFYCHLSETLSETRECFEKTGMTPFEYLDSLGLFEHGGGIYHGVHLTSDEIRLLAEKNVSVVINSASNCKLASGIAPLKELTDAGVNIGIGTDGPASNNSLDMFREMYLTSVLCKIRESDAACLDAVSILDMAVSGSAVCMGFDDPCVIAPGNRADIIMIDMHKPNMQPENNIIKNIVYSGNPENVIMTMVAGKILYRNGEYFLGFDPEEVYSDCEARLKALTGN